MHSIFFVNIICILQKMRNKFKKMYVFENSLISTADGIFFTVSVANKLGRTNRKMLL